MAGDGQTGYAVGGNKPSQQAEASTSNRGGGTLQMRILVELQVLNMLLAQAFESTEDLAKIRQDVSDSIT